MAAKKGKKQITNYIAIALDTSGSMGGIREDVRKAYNEMLRTIRDRTAAEGQQTYLSLVMFDSRVDVMFHPTDIRSVADIPPGGYPIRGQTALFDGVAKAVGCIQDHGNAADDVSYLVLVFTDGEENASFAYNAQRIRKLIEEKQQTDRWTFAFQMPPGSGKRFAQNFGIPTDNIREWEQTTKGVQEVQASTAKGLTDYLSARTVGATSVRSFYVTTDLSSVTKKDIKQLDDVTKQFKSYTVDKECSISSFVEYKTNEPYVIGSTFYQLTKVEKVQPTKNVLLVEKGKKTVWGGADARALIGLPPGADAKVTPGNHSDYDIYVQSTSPNRKLVRGTKVLIDTTLKNGLTPTWDYLAAAAAANKSA